VVSPRRAPAALGPRDDIGDPGGGHLAEPRCKPFRAPLVHYWPRRFASSFFTAEAYFAAGMSSSRSILQNLRNAARSAPTSVISAERSAISLAVIVSTGSALRPSSSMSCAARPVAAISVYRWRYVTVEPTAWMLFFPPDSSGAALSVTRSLCPISCVITHVTEISLSCCVVSQRCENPCLLSAPTTASTT